MGILICGFSGIGKTTLGKKYQNVAEIGQSLYKNIYLDKNAYTMDREYRKNIKTGVIPNPDWPMNYVIKIEELKETHDIVLVFTDLELMDALRRHHIPFFIALPETGRKDEFIENFRKRGQDDFFCKSASDSWDKNISYLTKMKEEKMWIPKGEYLENVLIKRGILKADNI